MKNFKIISSIFFFLICLMTYAQKVEFNGKKYHVKGEHIFLNGTDVTATLSTEHLNNIKNKLTREEQLKKVDKQKQKAESKQKKAEKKQKKVENELKKRKKAEKNYSDIQKKYSKEINKYEKLKKKGKLSTDDEVKWHKKLDNLKIKIEKNKKKLKRL